MKQLKRYLCAAVCAAVFLGALAPAASAAAGDFTDVPPAHWAYEDVMWARNSAVVDGVGNNLFAPGNYVNTAEMVKMLCGAFLSGEYQAYAAANPGQGAYWFSSMTDFFRTQGLLSGVSVDVDSYAGCTAAMTRNNMAQIIANVLYRKGMGVKDSQKEAAKAQIADFSAVPDSFRSAVLTCYSLGIINGTDGQFLGNDSMTRAQACAVIHRMDSLLNGGTAAAPGASATSGVPDVKEIGVTSKAGSIASMGLYGTGWYVDDNECGDGCLNNGKPITEENVIELLAKAQEIWPAGMTWAKSGNTGNNWYHDQGTVVKTLMTRNTLGTTIGLDSNFACGGFAAMISDYLFGRDNNNFHRVTDTVNGIRPGDIVFIIDPTTDTVYHAFIATSASFTQYEGNGTPHPGFVYKADGNSNGKVSWPGQYDSGTSEANSGYTWQVYSRYPD